MDKLTASYYISHSTGMKSFKPRIITPRWSKVLDVHYLKKADAIHFAQIEIDLLKSISLNTESQF